MIANKDDAVMEVISAKVGLNKNITSYQNIVEGVAQPIHANNITATSFYENVLLSTNSKLYANNDGTLLNIDGITNTLNIFGDGSCIATYPLNGNADDLSGNYNGTWIGNEQYDVGKFGQAARFDGSSYIQLHQYSVPITISFWCKNTDNNDIRCFSQKGYSNNGNNFNIYIQQNDGKVYFNGGYCDAQSNDSISNLDEFNHIVLVIPDNNLYNLTFFINGKKSASTITNSESNNIHFTDLIYLGLNRNNIKASNNTFFDQIRIFNKALTVDEVSILYNDTTYKVDISSNNLSAPPTNIMVKPDITLETCIVKNKTDDKNYIANTLDTETIDYVTGEYKKTYKSNTNIEKGALLVNKITGNTAGTSLTNINTKVIN